MRDRIRTILAVGGSAVIVAALVSAPAASSPGVTCDGHPATIVGVGGFVTGTSGDDVIVSFEDSQFIDAQAGNDIVCAGEGRDQVEGGPGIDRIFGEAGHDNLQGGRGDDHIEGQGGPDEIWGVGGDDYLIGGPDRDWVKGGDGNDDTCDVQKNDRVVSSCETII